MVTACLHIGITDIHPVTVDRDYGYPVIGFREHLGNPRRNFSAQQTVNCKAPGILLTLLQQLEQALLLLLHPLEGHVQEGQLIFACHVQIALGAYGPHQLPEGAGQPGGKKDSQ
ncbi:hypothetical protein D3C80_1862540 [compost metagenome]